MNQDRKKVFSNIVWLIFDKFILIVLNLVVVVKVANFYGASEYGLYQYALTILVMLELILYLVDERIVKKYFNCYDAEQLVFNVTIIRVFLSGIVIFCGCVYSYFFIDTSKFFWVFFVVLLSSVVTSLNFGMAKRFEFLLQSKRVVIAAELGNFFSIILQLVAVYLEFSIIFISFSYLVSVLLMLIILRIQYVKQFGRKVGHKSQMFDKSLIIKIFSESLPFSITQIMSVLYLKCDSIMIGMILSSAEVGIYSISLKFINVIESLILPVQTTIYIKMIEWYKENREIYERYYIKITSVMTWICISLIIFSNVVLPYIFTFFNEEYLAAMDVFKIHVWGGLFVYNGLLATNHMAITNNGYLLMYPKIATALCNVILNLIFIPQYGIVGAAVATVISQLCSYMICNLFFEEGRKVLKWQIQALNPINIIR